ncbi:auxin-binding protein ABP19a-like [Senna tora]|uniref:Germin-like protein n=1 Tax=Senna tora TaxID=362788 RepID=A0A834X526_9FABA|nr:auxin-binding protein ABP19a-like [Senna tora]
MIVAVVFTMFCLISCSDANNDLALDFCVADFGAPNYPSGYSCKNPLIVSSNDFSFSGLATPGIANNMIRASVARASVVLLMGASELIYVLQGKLTAAFISTNNTVYLNTLNQGDLMLFPRAYLHFIINQGKSSALIISSFSSENPGVQFVSQSLFGNNISTGDITRVSFVNPREVTRLKALFGGSG